MKLVVKFWLTWWDCVKDDIESLVLTHKDAQFRNKGAAG